LPIITPPTGSHISAESAREVIDAARQSPSQGEQPDDLVVNGVVAISLRAAAMKRKITPLRNGNLGNVGYQERCE